MSCLSIVRDLFAELGLKIPNAVVTSNDHQVSQMLALLNAEGKALTARNQNGWQVLLQEATFETTPVEAQATLSIIAPNMLNIVNDTIWNRTTRMPIYQISPQNWQARKGFINTSPYPNYRIANGEIGFSPVPTAGQDCYFEYVSKNWKTNEDGTVRGDSFTNDNDVSLLDENLLRMGLKWRWKHAKGFDYAEDKLEYEDMVNQAIARDMPKSKLSLNRTMRDLPFPYVPESGFGGI